MAKINCEVVKDLLPLYVDDVLSNESRMLVESHLAECPECRAYYEKLKDANIPVLKKADDRGKEIIKSIRQKINVKRLMAVCLTIVIVAAIATGLLYGIVIKESYIPYDESGLYVKDEYIKTDNNYYCSYGFYSPDNETEFIYLTTTVYAEHMKDRGTVEVCSLNDKSYSMDDDGNVTGEQTTKEIYYVSKENAKLLRNGYWVSAETEADYLAENQVRLDELKAASILIWKAE